MAKLPTNIQEWDKEATEVELNNKVALIGVICKNCYGLITSYNDDNCKICMCPNQHTDGLDMSMALFGISDDEAKEYYVSKQTNREFVE